MNNQIKKQFNSLKEFKSIHDIPDIPQVDDPDFYQDIIVTNLIRCGAIPKSDLIIGKTYKGSCRNSSEAVWDGKEFKYKRRKYHLTFIDTINHFEDDDGYDLFIPLEKINENE